MEKRNYDEPYRQKKGLDETVLRPSCNFHRCRSNGKAWLILKLLQRKGPLITERPVSLNLLDLCSNGNKCCSDPLLSRCYHSGLW